MDFGSLLSKTLQVLLACRHGSTRVVEGKTFCPDCGVGIVYQWAVIKCAHCQQKRLGWHRFGQLIPHQHCCVSCGEAGVQIEYHDHLEFFQLKYAVLTRTVLDDQDTLSVKFSSGRYGYFWGAVQRFSSYVYCC